jgi:hypothetical protein
MADSTPRDIMQGRPASQSPPHRRKDLPLERGWIIVDAEEEVAGQ